MSCSICYKQNVCIECCDQKFCLLDFFGSLHRNHFEKAKITDTNIFNKDYDICRRLKKDIEKSIANDIVLLDKEMNKSSIMVSRQHSESKPSWDTVNNENTKDSRYMDMSKLPPPPSITKNASDSPPILLNKLVTRSLRYRFEYLPIPVKNQVIQYYRSHNPIYDSTNATDDVIFNRELSSIVMQIVSVVVKKQQRGELLNRTLNTLSQSMDSWQAYYDYIRELDFNILKCDDVEIIRKILMKEVLDITEVNFGEFFSHNKKLNISDGISRDQRMMVDKTCEKCGNTTMLRLLIRGYNPVSTHDETWVNKDSVDYLVEFECAKCGHKYRTDNPLE